MGKLTPQARRLWRSIPAQSQFLLLNNVFCGNCRGSVTIVRWSGKIRQGDLVLKGDCETCGGPVARLIESEWAQPLELFTVVAEFAGGTYLAQVEASSPQDAAAQWPSSRHVQSIAPFVGLPVNEFLGALKAPRLEPLEGFANAWSASAEVEGDLLVLHLIKTAE